MAAKKVPQPAVSETRLTYDILYKLGFRGEGKEIFGNAPTFRLSVPYNSRLCKHGYYYDFQICLMEDVPDSNPNSGILSLYRAETKDCHMVAEEEDEMKVDFVLWNVVNRGDGKPTKGGIKYVDDKETNFPIAHHVTTLERLNAIYTAITRNDPLKIKEPKPISRASKKRIMDRIKKGIKKKY